MGSRRKLQEALAQRGDISGLAKQVLGISRPTIYRYIDYYESGSREKVPLHIKAYFQAALQPELHNLLDIYERCLHQLRMIEHELSDVEEEYRSFGISISLLGKNGKPLAKFESVDLPEDVVPRHISEGEIDLETGATYDHDLMSKKELTEFLTRCGNEYRGLEKEASELCDRILSTPKIQEWGGEQYSSVMYVSKDRLMVILGGTEVRGLAVEVSIQMGGKDTVIGVFRPKEGCRYVTISDLLPGPDYSYAIVDEADKQGSEKDRIRFKLE